jgi:hypothetical protein
MGAVYRHALRLVDGRGIAVVDPVVILEVKLHGSTIVGDVTIAALVGRAKGSVTSKYIHTLDTALIMAADTISGYIQGLLDGIEFKQTAYALHRGSRKAALARFLKRASGGDPEEGEEERRLAA